MFENGWWQGGIVRPYPGQAATILETSDSRTSEGGPTAIGASGDTHLQRLVAAARVLAEAFDRGEFLPLMEADVDGYLLHVLLEQGGYAPQDLHQNARIKGVEKRRYDLVAGRVDLNPRDRSRAACSEPWLVVQGKFFPRWGFTAQQQNVHLGHVLEDDIPSLGDVRVRWPSATTCALLVDLYFTPNLRGYLSGKMGGRRRIDAIAERCHAARASLIWIHPETESRTSVDLLETKAQER